ncbi:uncharacterized protein N7477_006983 [Penicillium maclennaniae]|uniref:uncharacterized protein n=1 Tax=Penicillium maclennaniae TaxID=1343394 RepID=UPI00254163FD|nr:uncharacterized protein N7477_006983 [Penicillium maclennaniae]KAJ5668413.1 hypothetical protein N7477_006983 [Penicillium maclennaniae]
MADSQVSQPPRRSRGFSVKSEKSHKSGNSGHKSQLSESSEEKHRRNLQTKADPTVAMNELQPMAVALEKSNLGSLREMEHKDQFGNVITDPDWSNPTRPRFERPLDTIKSFEAAIYGTYNSNRHSYIKTDEAASQMGDHSRRTSYQGQNGHSNRGYDQNANYSRTGPSRPDSVTDNYGQENQNPYQNRRQRQPRRTDSDQAGYNGYQSKDPYGQGNEPNSVNNSMDQLSQYAQQQRADGGYNGQSSMGNSWGPTQQAQGQGPPVMRMTKTANTAIVAPPEKTKGWFKRRFSKQ